MSNTERSPVTQVTTSRHRAIRQPASVRTTELVYEPPSVHQRGSSAAWPSCRSRAALNQCWACNELTHDAASGDSNVTTWFVERCWVVSKLPFVERTARAHSLAGMLDAGRPLQEEKSISHGSVKHAS